MISIFFSNKAFLIKIQRKTQKTEFIYKKWCIYFYMFKLQSPSNFSPFDAMHLLRLFFHCSKQFLNLLILMPFSTSAIFCFTSPTSAKHFPLKTFFIQGNKKKVAKGDIRRVEREGHRGCAAFWSKIAEHSAQCGQVRSYIIMKWANTLKVSSKKIYWSRTQPLTTMPAGTLIHMGLYNTHLVGEACIIWSPPSRR